MSDPKTNHPDPARCTMCRELSPTHQRTFWYGTTYYYCDDCWEKRDD